MIDPLSLIEGAALAMVVAGLVEWTLNLGWLWPYWRRVYQQPDWPLLKSLLAAVMLMLGLLVAVQAIFLLISVVAILAPPAIRPALQLAQYVSTIGLLGVEVMIIVIGAAVWWFSLRFKHAEPGTGQLEIDMLAARNHAPITEVVEETN